VAFSCCFGFIFVKLTTFFHFHLNEEEEDGCVGEGII